MKARRWLFSGTAIGVAILSCSVLFATTASARTVNPYGSGAYRGAIPNAITGPKYDFCNVNGCPSAVWKVDFTTGKFKDSFKDKGTFTHSGKNYTFVFPNIEGSGVSCTFLGVKNATGFNSSASQGTYTCTDGTDTTWYATLIS